MPPGMSRRLVASMMRPAFSVGSCVAMAVTRSPEMPTSARYVSVAVTTVALRITVSKRMEIPQREHYTPRVRSAVVMRQDFVFVDCEGLLFLAGRSVDVELGDAGLAETGGCFAWGAG